jgi:predicted lipoprotein with Yx(FWY)xxD motif
MTPSRALTLLAGAAVAPLTALAVAGCGGSSTSSGSSKSPAQSKDTYRPPTVDVSTNPRLGELLVDSKGRTLYLFKKDNGTRTACFGSCAQAWPPLRTKDKPRAAGDAKASKLATTKRPDGPPQVTYNGHPLYLYQGDETPGKVNGQGVNAWGGLWYVLSPAGKQMKKGSPKKGAASSGY